MNLHFTSLMILTTWFPHVIGLNGLLNLKIDVKNEEM